MKENQQNDGLVNQADQETQERPEIHEDVISLILDLVEGAFPVKDGRASEVAQRVIDSISPRDDIEAMLVGQMVATHNLAMLMLARGGIEFCETSPQGFPAAGKATKLLNVFTHQMEALKNYRGKSSTQKIVVEQVKVESGGQAVVGNVDTGGGGDVSGRKTKK